MTEKIINKKEKRKFKEVESDEIETFFPIKKKKVYQKTGEPHGRKIKKAEEWK